MVTWNCTGIGNSSAKGVAPSHRVELGLCQLDGFSMNLFLYHFVLLLLFLP